jgi:serine/threonine-protein kinase RIO1
MLNVFFKDVYTYELFTRSDLKILEKKYCINTIVPKPLYFFSSTLSMMINTKCLNKSIPKLSNPTTKHTKDYHSFTIMQILIYPNGIKSEYNN